MIGKDPAGLKHPVRVDTTGAVVISGTVSSIGNVETILNAQTGIETVMAADVSAIKTQLATGSIAVTGGGSSSVQMGSGVVTSTTQRVTLASDGPEVTNSTQIKNSVANIPSKGAATTANSTPVNIASDQTVPVSIASVPSHAVTNAGTFEVQNTAAVVGGNATAVKVDGSAVTQPVSGTVSVSGTVPVTGTFYQATQPVSLASVPSHPVTNTGTFAVQASGAVTSNPPAGSLTMTNSSVGTTSATLLAASSATKLLVVQNTHATQSLYVSTTTPATATNGILIPPTWGYEFPYIPTNALYCLGSGASTTYTLWYA